MSSSYEGMMLDARSECERLRQAVRKHRDQQGDDRCWMDDEELYRALPEGYDPPAREVAVELENCRAFIQNRQHPQTEYVSLQREIERLRAIIARLLSACMNSADRCYRGLPSDRVDLGNAIKAAEEFK